MVGDNFESQGREGGEEPARVRADGIAGERAGDRIGIGPAGRESTRNRGGIAAIPGLKIIVGNGQGVHFILRLCGLRAVQSSR